MRSLDECRAEVFARSEKRIAKRRKIRRRATAGLATLCFCLILLTVLPMMSNQKKHECMPEEFGNAGCAGAPECDTVDTEKQKATVIDRAGEQWNLPEDQTEQLSRLLDAYLTDGKLAKNQKEADYEIEIQTEEGKTVCYHLSGSYLTCEGQTVKLSEFRLQQLLELLQPVSQ